MDKENLIKMYKEKNNLFIEKIIVDYTNYIIKIIKNMTNNLSNEDIEGIVIDVFLAIWKNKDKLNEELPIEPYIVGVTKNIVKNRFRKIKFNYNIDDYENEFKEYINMDELIEEKEKNEIIKKELNLMKEQDRIIFTLFYYHSKSIKEIAKELKITTINAKTRLHRIRTRIKRSLLKGGYSDEK